MAKDNVSRSVENGVNHSGQELNCFSTNRLFSGMCSHTLGD